MRRFLDFARNERMYMIPAPEFDDFTLTCFVIASEAKQSTDAPLDCFASLAMTILPKIILL